ncbi:hypothetical protein ACV3V0_18565 [Clostridium perfringens]
MNYDYSKVILMEEGESSINAIDVLKKANIKAKSTSAYQAVVGCEINAQFESSIGSSRYDSLENKKKIFNEAIKKLEEDNELFDEFISRVNKVIEELL